MSSKRQCAFPECDKPGTKTCTGCGEVGYCGKEHQIGHWKTHKTTCKQKVNKDIQQMTSVASGLEVESAIDSQRHPVAAI